MKSGYATYKNGSLYFDDNGWAILKSVAKKKHKSPTTLVVQALWRMKRRLDKKK